MTVNRGWADTQYDAIIVGAGAAGLFAAYALSRHRPGARVLVADAGRALAERQRSGAAELGGSGGAGIFLGGRLYLGPATIPAMPAGIAPAGMRPVLEGERYLERACEVDALLASLGVRAEVREAPPERLRAAVEQARAVGLDYVVSYPARLLSVDERRGMLGALLADLAGRGVAFAYGTTVSRAERAAEGFRVSLSAMGDGHRTISELTARSLLLAPGRYGAEWLVGVAHEVGAEVVALPTAYGVRVEAPAHTYQPLTDVNPDPRLQLTLPDDAIFKTYATCPGGQVAPIERYGRTVASGVPASAAERGPNTTVALLLQPGAIGAEGRWRGGAEVAHVLNERTPGRLVVQRLGDLRHGVATTAAVLADNVVRPTYAHAQPGVLGDVYPADFWDAMDDLLGRIDQLAPGVAADETLVYGPAEERFWHFPTDGRLETTTPGLFVAGDGPGQTQGAMQAGVAGLLAGAGIADFLAQ